MTEKIPAIKSNKTEETKDIKEKTSEEILNEYIQKYSWLWEDNSPLNNYKQKTK